jgi:hypothetical protein
MLRLLLSLQPVFFAAKCLPSAECLQKHQTFGGGEGGGWRGEIETKLGGGQGDAKLFWWGACRLQNSGGRGVEQDKTVEGKGVDNREKEIGKRI